MNSNDAQKQWLIDHDFFDHEFLQILTGQIHLNPDVDLCEALARHGRLTPEQADHIRQQVRQGRTPSASESIAPFNPLQKPGSSSQSLQIPGYNVSGELGRGGMGVVYLGEQAGTSAEVVIKCLLKGEPSLDLMTRFHREARVLAQFSHKNIVTIKDFGTQDGQPYMVMNRVPGHDLKHCVTDKIQRDKILPALDWVIAIMTEVAEGLAACHQKGIVHRDLKPENIMIEENSETPIIIDFGLAQVDEGAKSSTILETLGNKLTKDCTTKQRHCFL
ncbi:MAG: serine/threonine-protein kinase [Planctomycetota bacterium]|nr:serine/threonine-protein kinase [Planctomycetota bacterium]